MARYLGELKNLALYNALGEWCFPWPDDCEIAPDYINWHMHRRSKDPDRGQQPCWQRAQDGIAHTLDWEAAPFASFFRFGPHIYDQDGSDVRFLRTNTGFEFSRGRGRSRDPLFLGLCTS
jgi:hypothetical protein